jgi:hypothetical protein|tara:strand:+ start:255 stop:1277 length:1023 start_codon:yes stop_codon:yes gene_type:complete
MQMNKSTILILIPSYRDDDLVPTINDAIEKASNKDRLYFGICWQHSESESLNQFMNNERFKILSYHWSDAKGLGWARKKLECLYDDEDFILQLDSHHRFEKDWDKTLVKTWNDANKKTDYIPIITTYGTPYTIKDGKAELLLDVPCRIGVHHFNDKGNIFFRCEHLPEELRGIGPTPSRWLSAHFLFTKGSFIKDVPQDQDIYFGGETEEIALGIRAFTHGYDMFVPDQLLFYHKFDRDNRILIWDDHNEQNKSKGIIDVTYNEGSYKGQKKFEQLINCTDKKKYAAFGLGTKRTIKEYAAFAGINFKNKTIQQYSLEGLVPPNTKKIKSKYIKPDDYKG